MFRLLSVSLSLSCLDPSCCVSSPLKILQKNAHAVSVTILLSEGTPPVRWCSHARTPPLVMTCFESLSNVNVILARMRMTMIMMVMLRLCTRYIMRDCYRPVTLPGSLIGRWYLKQKLLWYKSPGCLFCSEYLNLAYLDMLSTGLR